MSLLFTVDRQGVLDIATGVSVVEHLRIVSSRGGILGDALRNDAFGSDSRVWPNCDVFDETGTRTNVDNVANDRRMPMVRPCRGELE